MTKLQLKFKLTAVNDFKIVDGTVRLDIEDVTDIVMIHKTGGEDKAPSVVIDDVTVTK